MSHWNFRARRRARRPTWLTAQCEVDRDQQISFCGLFWDYGKPKFHLAFNILAESERGMRPRTRTENPQKTRPAHVCQRQQHSKRNAKENTDKAAPAVIGTTREGGRGGGVGCGRGGGGARGGEGGGGADRGGDVDRIGDAVPRSTYAPGSSQLLECNFEGPRTGP